LEVTIKEEVAWGFKEYRYEFVVVVFEKLFVEVNMSKFEKVVFEVIQVPRHALTIESSAWVAFVEVDMF
jgi:hypothetical protein